jgi:hypothetical protein
MVSQFAYMQGPKFGSGGMFKHDHKLELEISLLEELASIVEVLVIGKLLVEVHYCGQHTAKTE